METRIFSTIFITIAEADIDVGATLNLSTSNTYYLDKLKFLLCREK